MTIEEKRKAIDALKISAPVIPMTQEEFNDYIQTLNQMMDWLEQEPCEDAISRAKAMTEIMMNTNIREHLDGNLYIKVADAVQILRDLPSVKPQEPKTGYWITHEEQFNALGMAVKGGVKCSECGYTTHNKLHMEIGCPYKFCPDCGAKMEDKEE